MLKFTTNARELKNVLDKEVVSIDKKAINQKLKNIYFYVDEKSKTLKSVATHGLEAFAEVNVDASIIEPGCFGISIDDVKVLSKLTGEVILMDDGNKICVKNGKKVLTVPKYENTDVFLPEMDETETNIINCKESWLLETISNLDCMTSHLDNNIPIQCFNFNMKKERVEALDGNRIGTRSLSEQEVINKYDNIMLHNMCVPVFKKLLNKKSDDIVKMSQDKKYVKVEGKNFTYIIKKCDGKYFNIDNMINSNFNKSFTVNCKNFFEVCNDAYNLIKLQGKECRVPMIMHMEEGKIYAYTHTVRYESFTSIDAEHIIMDDMIIGFNPRYLTEALGIIDVEKANVKLVSSKAPIIIEGNEYLFFILPVHIKDGINYEEVFRRLIEKAA